MAVALMCAPVTAQQTPAQERDTVEKRLSPGGEDRAQDRRPSDRQQDRSDRNRSEERDRREDRRDRGEQQDRRDRQSQNENRQQREQQYSDRNLSSPQQQAAADQLVANFLTGKLILMNQSIVQMSRVAEQRATSEEVKQFAQQLAENHASLTHELQTQAPQITAIVALDRGIVQRTAGYRGIAGEDQADQSQEHAQKGEKKEHKEHKEHAQKDESKPADRSSADSAQQDQSADQNAQTDPQQARRDRIVQNRIAQGPLQRILEVERNATENYIQSSQRILDKYEGAEFDMAFLGFQIGSHTWALAELQAMEAASDDQKFKTLVADVKSHMEQHLAKAKELSRHYEEGKSNNRQ